MKSIIKTITLIITSFLITTSAFSKVESFFTPHEGKQAFDKIYDEIANAKESVEITIYSWSAAGLEKAIKKAVKNHNPEIRVVLHPKLYKKESIQKKVTELEKLGVRFKVSTKDMHEKFVIVDDVLAMNTSGNFSNGAQNNYSENLIFHYDDGELHLKKLIDAFEYEFEVLWNFSKPANPNNTYTNTVSELDFKTKNLENNKAKKSVNTFLSSSMNFDGKKVNSAKQRPLALKIKKSKPWVIRDAIIDELDKAQHSVLLNLNHFFIKEIADKLIELHKRGIEVKFAVDNQEFKTGRNTKEMTPYFVREWMKLNPGKEEDIPVRIKFYSHRPSFRYWKLNHHKYMIVDYGHANQVLINGSYNLSKKAEQGQFDNMVVYKGAEYADTIDQFYGEFMNMWNYKRNNDDSLDKSFFKYFYRKVDGFYPIHHYSAQSLTWHELHTFKKDFAKKMGVRYLRIRSPKNHCKGFLPKAGTFHACPQ
jgi:phosphatidylserine/phosphatidylglycerophosphate/cardiolipin synthase-like enzyme